MNNVLNILLEYLLSCNAGFESSSIFLFVLFFGAKSMLYLED
jgi:hypothetical protein